MQSCTYLHTRIANRAQLGELGTELFQMVELTDDLSDVILQNRDLLIQDAHQQ